MVKEVSKKHHFGNPFDVTKLDDTSKFPQIMIDRDYFLLHLGGGRHRFVKGINKGFHNFENVTKKIKWEYKKSLLNEFDTSESNILSVGFNKKIIHEFLYEDINADPKIYLSRRTKITFNYYAGNYYVRR